MAPADLEPVSSIEQESLSPWTLAQIREELLHPSSLVFVAESGNAVVIGWCCCRVVAGEAELLKIAVGRGSRKQGVGRLLLDTLCTCLNEKNVFSLFLEVRSQNTVALALYRSYGLSPIGKRAGYYSNPVDDAVIMKLALPKQENTSCEETKI